MSKEMQKYFYDYWKNANWDTNKLNDLVTKDLDIKTIRRNAKDYAINELGLTEDEFYEQLETPATYVQRDGTYKPKKNFKEYEKLSDLETISEIKKSFDSVQHLYPGIKYYVKRYRKYEPDLVEELRKKVSAFGKYDQYFEKLEKIRESQREFKQKGNSEYEKKFTLSQRKKHEECFEYCEKATWVTPRLKNIKPKDLSIKEIRKNAILYLTEALGLSSKDFYDLIKYRNCKSPSSAYQSLFVAYEKLYDCDDSIEEIEKYLSDWTLKNKSDLKKLKLDIFEHILIMYDRSEREDLEQELNKKAEIYYASELQKRKEEQKEKEKMKNQQRAEYEKETLPLAKEIIADFVKSPYNIKEYIESLSISHPKFNSYVKIIKKYDEELYNQYKNKTETESKMSFSILIGKGKKMINLIEEGIKVDGAQPREFDLLDYDNMTTLEPTELYSVIKSSLSPTERRTFLRFIGKYENDKNLNIKATMETTYKILDKDGHERLITNEEKKRIINYLKEKNGHVTQKRYGLAMKKYLNDQLFEAFEATPDESKQRK